MFGYPDSAECPLDFRGNSLTVNEFKECAENHYSEGGLLPNPPDFEAKKIIVRRDGTGYVYGPGPISEGQRITVNKTTHRIRFENETESSVEIVIQPKPEALGGLQADASPVESER